MMTMYIRNQSYNETGNLRNGDLGTVSLFLEICPSIGLHDSVPDFLDTRPTRRDSPLLLLNRRRGIRGPFGAARLAMRPVCHQRKAER